MPLALFPPQEDMQPCVMTGFFLTPFPFSSFYSSFSFSSSLAPRLLSLSRPYQLEYSHPPSSLSPCPPSNGRCGIECLFLLLSLLPFLPQSCAPSSPPSYSLLSCYSSFPLPYFAAPFQPDSFSLPRFYNPLLWLCLPPRRAPPPLHDCQSTPLFYHLLCTWCNESWHSPYQPKSSDVSKKARVQSRQRMCTQRHRPRPVSAGCTPGALMQNERQ
mmetsp:Transcript_21771/g.64160  ORF Transcript_21771/g.64160 Transcript_21771/m.64160 type:complete len:215 (+) Transcript_21771:2238-2882(+)